MDKELKEYLSKYPLQTPDKQFATKLANRLKKELVQSKEVTVPLTLNRLALANIILSILVLVLVLPMFFSLQYSTIEINVPVFDADRVVVNTVRFKVIRLGAEEIDISQLNSRFRQTEALTENQ